MSQNTVKDFYSNEMEKDRLELELFKLEGLRTKKIIARYLTAPPMKIADIGGAAGFYSFWLQAMGHQVTLVDLTPRNIELALEYSKKSGIQLSACLTGDATRLELTDAQFDLVLLMGPLYHLVNRDDRIKALSEARRIAKPGSYVLSAIISRYASLFDGFKRDLINDNRFEQLLADDLATGIHLNKTDNPEYFTTAYFHTANDIKQEIRASGLEFEKLLAVESFGWIIDAFERKSQDDGYMKKLNRFIELVETNEDLMAMSQHIIAISRKGSVSVV